MAGEHAELTAAVSMFHSVEGSTKCQQHSAVVQLYINRTLIILTAMISQLIFIGMKILKNIVQIVRAMGGR